MNAEAPPREGTPRGEASTPAVSPMPADRRKLPDPFDTPTAAPGVRRDRFGRYLLPDPDGPASTTRAWTRATTWAASVADTYGLTRWQMRMVAKGIALRSDLYALAAAAPVDDRQTLDRVAADAKEAAGSSAGANAGSALHAFTERLDRGEEPSVPEPWAADIAAYRTALVTHGVSVEPEFIERVVVVRSLLVAGTLDRIVRLPDGRLYIGDVKSGKDLSYAWGEIAIQLAIYANADAMWNTATGAYEPMPAVDRVRAVVMHIPAGRGRCNLYDVDIESGWEMAQVCGTVRAWRGRKDLAAPLGRPVAAALADRVASAATVQALTAVWIEADRRGLWTEELTAAARTRKTELARESR